MARKHPQPLSLIRSRFCSVVTGVEFSGRKLIIFMLVQLLLSPFILITGDSINESVHNGKPPPLPSSSPVYSINAGADNPTSDQFIKTHASNENDNGNSILRRVEGNIASEQRPSVGNLSFIGNASILDQSRLTNLTCNSDECEQQHHHHDKTFNDGHHHDERVLSRKRRYLIFPPGSSMQIVYDTYQPILGYSNYLILGVTAAMAWELPSKPIYLDEELRESYEMGELPLLQRNDKNISNSQYSIPSKFENSIQSNYYYTNIPKQKIAYTKYDQPSKLSYNNGIYGTQNRIDSSNKIQNYVLYADKLVKQFKEITDKIPQNRPLSPSDFQQLANILAKNVKSNSAKKTNPKRKNYRHFIHPAFKKRSIEDLTLLDKFDLNLHRKSRHALYRQMDTFLKTQGSNGNDCILKMLCETGQRDRDEEPGSMVIELLRAIFTLPSPIDTVQHPAHRQYDEAHASAENCQKIFPKCRESVWSSKYM